MGDRSLVRQRAHCGCEFCGVTETDTGGELTIDHFQPRSQGGVDDLENLVYCCHRCNQYKADYWPYQPSDVPLWNPRQDSPDTHIMLLADGTLYPLTAVGEFTIRRLRLNRSPLIAYRLQKQKQTEETQLLKRYQEVVAALEHLHTQHLILLNEHQKLLQEQRNLLRRLLGE